MHDRLYTHAQVHRVPTSLRFRVHGTVVRRTKRDVNRDHHRRGRFKQKLLMTTDIPNQIYGTVMPMQFAKSVVRYTYSGTSECQRLNAVPLP